jgi:hypothetical protein
MKSVKVVIEAETETEQPIIVAMRYGQTIGDLIYELISTRGQQWRDVLIMNIHDKVLPDVMPLRGDMTVHTKKRN